MIKSSILFYLAVIIVVVSFGCAHVTRHSKPSPATPSQTTNRDSDQWSRIRQSGVGTGNELQRGSDQTAIRADLHKIGMGWRGGSNGTTQPSITRESLLQAIPALQFDSVSLIPLCAIDADMNGPDTNNEYWLTQWDMLAAQRSIAGLGGATVDGDQCAFTYAPRPVGYGLP